MVYKMLFCFSFFLPWPTESNLTFHKIGQGQFRVIIYTSFVEIVSQMLHTKNNAPLKLLV